MPRKRKTPAPGTGAANAAIPSQEVAAPSKETKTAPQHTVPPQSKPQASTPHVRNLTTPTVQSTNKISSASRNPAPAAAPPSNPTSTATNQPKTKDKEEEKKDDRPIPPLIPLPSTTYRLVWYHDRSGFTAPTRCTPNDRITIAPNTNPPKCPGPYTATLTRDPDLVLAFACNYGRKQVYLHQHEFEDYTLITTDHIALVNKGCTSIAPEDFRHGLAAKSPQMWGDGKLMRDGKVTIDGELMVTGKLMGKDDEFVPGSEKTMRVPLTVGMSCVRDDDGEQFVEFWGWRDGKRLDGGLVWAVGKKVAGRGVVGDLSVGERERLGIREVDWLGVGVEEKGAMCWKVEVPKSEVRKPEVRKPEVRR